MYASASVSALPAAPPGGDDGCSSSRSQPQPWPKLELDSGASIHHVVGDPRLLSNLRDAPAGMRVTVADGNTLPITKIGDIQMPTAGFMIPGVHLAPGLKSDLISVRELTRQSRICTWFDGDCAMLYAGPDLVGVAVAPQSKKGVYILESLSVPEIAAASSGKLVPVWFASSALASQSRTTSICKNSFGSMLCWLKALPCARPFSAEPEEKPIREVHVSDKGGAKRRRIHGE